MKEKRALLVVALTVFMLMMSMGLQAQNHTYTESHDVIANPDRGFYLQYSYFFDKSGKHGVSSNPLTKETIAANRAQGITLYLLYYCMPDYLNADIDATSKPYLNLQSNLRLLALNGAQAIVRFCYSNIAPETKADGSFDGAGQNASKEMILKHINAFTPLLQTYKSTVYALEAGFLGTWGEWYYTDIKDDKDRNAILDALQTAVSGTTIPVLVRTPGYARSYIKYKGYTGAGLDQEADLDKLAFRLGIHDDAILNGNDDQGTFIKESTGTTWEEQSDWDWTERATKVCPFGGETDAFSAEAQNLATANKFMNRYHINFLNATYHQDVISFWKATVFNNPNAQSGDTYFTHLSKYLGYRFVLTSATFNAQATAGSDYEVKVKVKNRGYSSTYHKRDILVKLVDESGNTVASASPTGSTDPRKWFPGDYDASSNQASADPEYEFKATLKAPSTAGTYKVVVTLGENAHGETQWTITDECGIKTTQKPNGELFYLRFANTEQDRGFHWDADHGYNELGSVTVK